MKHLRIVTFALAAATLAWSDSPAKELDEVARAASVMVDGDVCERIVTPRAHEFLLKEHPRDKWAAADNFDVDHEAYIQTKKTLIRLSRLSRVPADVNLWMPIPGPDSRVQILIRNAAEISQFWKWGDLHQPMTAEMQQVLTTGKRAVVARRPGFVSVLAPVSNSVGDIVGFVEVVARSGPDSRENVK